MQAQSIQARVKEEQNQWVAKSFSWEFCSEIVYAEILKTFSILLYYIPG